MPLIFLPVVSKKLSQYLLASCFLSFQNLTSIKIYISLIFLRIIFLCTGLKSVMAVCFLPRYDDRLEELVSYERIALSDLEKIEIGEFFSYIPENELKLLTLKSLNGLVTMYLRQLLIQSSQQSCRVQRNTVRDLKLPLRGTSNGQKRIFFQSSKFVEWSLSCC